MAESVVASLDTLAPGTVRTVDLDGVSVLLANVDGEVHAVRALCSHEGAPLADGELDGAAIECPWHFSRFCLKTGEALDPPATDPIEAYSVRVVDGEILVRHNETEDING